VVFVVAFVAVAFAAVTFAAAFVEHHCVGNALPPGLLLFYSAGNSVIDRAAAHTVSAVASPTATFATATVRKRDAIVVLQNC